MNKAEKLFKSLNIPDDVFNPITALKGRQGDWNLLFSTRSRGKTTNVLLLGMCYNWTQGTQIQYIRQYDDMLAPKITADLMRTILEYNYIDKITSGQYNSCKYVGRRWYYTKIADGEEVERAKEPFMVCLAINRNVDYKSSYNAPKGDFIVVDEWMRTDKSYMRDEFLILCDLLSTIIRLRTTAKIYMLTNLVDITCPYLLEMGIQDIVRNMKFGDFQQLINKDSESGTETTISIYMIPPEAVKSKSKSKYFGLWDAAKLTGITGAKGMWTIKMYPHAPREEYTILDKAQIELQDGYICRELREYASGLYVMFYPLGVPLTDKVTYTWDSTHPFNNLRRYGMGYSQTDHYVMELIKLHRVYYSDNTTGERVETYIKKLI